MIRLRNYNSAKVLNKVSIIFNVKSGSQTDYQAHDKLALVRVNEEGNNVFLSDYTNEGDAYFGGDLIDNKYEFSNQLFLSTY